MLVSLYQFRRLQMQSLLFGTGWLILALMGFVFGYGVGLSNPDLPVCGPTCVCGAVTSGIGGIILMVRFSD